MNYNPYGVYNDIGYDIPISNSHDEFNLKHKELCDRLLSMSIDKDEVINNKTLNNEISDKDYLDNLLINIIFKISLGLSPIEIMNSRRDMINFTVDLDNINYGYTSKFSLNDVFEYIQLHEYTFIVYFYYYILNNLNDYVYKAIGNDRLKRKEYTTFIHLLCFDALIKDNDYVKKTRY